MHRSTPLAAAIAALLALAPRAVAQGLGVAESEGTVDAVMGPMVLIDDDAGWCWSLNHNAVIDPTTGRVHAVSTGAILGITRRAGDPLVRHATFDPSTGLSHTQTLDRAPEGSPPVTADGTGALWVRPDGRLVHVWAGYDRAHPTGYALSEPTDAHPQPAWGGVTTLPSEASPAPPSDRSYAVPQVSLHYLSGEGGEDGRLWCITGSSAQPPVLTYSDDLGETWRPAGPLLAAHDAPAPAGDEPAAWGSLRFVSNGTDRIDFLCTELSPTGVNTSVYHGYIRGGQSFDSFGEVVDDDLFDGDAPNPNGFTPVFLAAAKDGVADGDEFHHGRALDLHLRPDGRPVALYVTRLGDWPDGPARGQDDHRLFYAAYDGFGWVSTELARMGEPILPTDVDSVGLASIHPEDPGRVYLSTRIDPRNEAMLPRHEVFVGLTDNDGVSWEWVPLTWASTVDNVGPRVPHPRGGPTVVVWTRGDLRLGIGMPQSLVAVVEGHEAGTPRMHLPLGRSIGGLTIHLQPPGGEYDVYAYFRAPDAATDALLQGAVRRPPRRTFTADNTQRIPAWHLDDLHRLGIETAENEWLYRAYLGRFAISQENRADCYFATPVDDAVTAELISVGLIPVEPSP